MPTEFLMETRTKNILDSAGNSSRGSVRLRMAYGGFGRRVSKTRERKTETGDWVRESVTHYTGIGTEVRENYSEGSFQDARVVVNMPHGLGRYGISNVILSDSEKSSNSQPNEFYLKNHLGSTMMVAKVSSSNAPAEISAAYDYRAFGEQITLSEPTEKVTENFTGKERDDETALNYFGARYLDPMIGLWISVDPKRQFSSPYLYAGNGMNPVNGVDGDGSYFRYSDEATEHAVMQYVKHISPEARFRFNQLATSRYRYDIMKVEGVRIDPDDGDDVGGLAKPWAYKNGEIGGAAYFANIDFFLHEVLSHLYDFDNSLKENFGDVNATIKDMDTNRDEYEQRARAFEKQTLEDADDE